ncbi:MAG: MFS transporter [Gaiellaceae bacterium]
MAFLILLALAALDAAGYSIIAPIVPEIGEATGGGPALMGLLVASFAVGQIAAYPVAGRGIQHRHAVVVIAVSLALIVVGDLGFILGEGLRVYFPARVIQGIGAGGLWMGISFAVIERYPGREFQRLTGVTAAYGVGAIAGPAIGGAGGIRTPFLIHLGLVLLLAVALTRVGAPREAIAFRSDRAALRSAGFWLASAGILLVALTLGAFDGPLPLHFSEHLGQAEIAGLYVAAALIGAICATLAGYVPPRPSLAVATVLLPAGVALAGATSSVPLWVLAAVIVGVGLGAGEAGSLGVLLETIGVERMIVAMVVWSQLWAVGYLAGPAAGGGVAEAFGFSAIGVVPVAAALGVVAAFAAARRERARSGASPGALPPEPASGNGP